MKPLRSMMMISFAAALILGRSAHARAEIVEERVEYSEGGTTLIGFRYSDSAAKTKAPGVIVFSDWLGVGDFAKDRARELVKLGYRAFVADIYGGGQLLKGPKEAGPLAGKFKGDRPLFRARTQAALKALLQDPLVDSSRVGAIGFCFGGTAVLELGRSGAPVAALVSFHGGLDTPEPALGKQIKGSVLVLHGADDPHVPVTDVRAFEDEMRNGGVRWELVEYGGAVHAFTNPAVGTDTKTGAAYNETVSNRAFARMRDFLKEQLGH